MTKNTKIVAAVGSLLVMCSCCGWLVGEDDAGSAPRRGGVPAPVARVATTVNDAAVPPIATPRPPAPPDAAAPPPPTPLPPPPAQVAATPTLTVVLPFVGHPSRLMAPLAIGDFALVRTARQPQEPPTLPQTGTWAIYRDPSRPRLKLEVLIEQAPWEEPSPPFRRLRISGETAYRADRDMDGYVWVGRPAAPWTISVWVNYADDRSARRDAGRIAETALAAVGEWARDELAANLSHQARVERMALIDGVARERRCLGDLPICAPR